METELANICRAYWDEVRGETDRRFELLELEARHRADQSKWLREERAAVIAFLCEAHQNAPHVVASLTRPEGRAQVPHDALPATIRTMFPASGQESHIVRCPDCGALHQVTI